MSNDERLEAEHYQRVISAFANYSRRMKERTLARHFRDWNSLTNVEQSLSTKYLRKLSSVEAAADVNQSFFNAVVDFAGESADGSNSFLAAEMTTERDYDNLRSTLRQLVRDWSDIGAPERNLCYPLIIQTLENFFESKTDGKKILIPGAGLGRLAYEIATRGFTVQGNEFSLYMLLTSQLILNGCRQVAQFSIQPFAFPLSNHLSINNSLRTVQLPDILPDLPENVDFSMTAGDFLDIYSASEHINTWDSVVTCFFLDTAQNVLQYLALIWKVLKPGGLWLNLGPLQYHFEGTSLASPERSIELSWEEIIDAAEGIGFSFRDREHFKLIDMPYAHDPFSLNRTLYRAILSQATKPL